MSQRSVTFKATFPPIQSAITITGEGAGMRITLEIPEIELANALGILVMRESVLEITIVDKGKMPINLTNSRTSADDVLDVMANDD